jgi:hypothetical protein
MLFGVGTQVDHEPAHHYRATNGDDLVPAAKPRLARGAASGDALAKELIWADPRHDTLT